MLRGKRTRGRDTGEPEHDTAVESVGDLLGWVRDVPKNGVPVRVLPQRNRRVAWSRLPSNVLSLANVPNGVSIGDQNGWRVDVPVLERRLSHRHSRDELGEQDEGSEEGDGESREDGRELHDCWA